MECARRGVSWKQNDLDVVAGLAQGRGGGAAGEPGADDDDVELAAVGRVDERGLELAGGPLVGDRAGGALVSATGSPSV